VLGTPTITSQPDVTRLRLGQFNSDGRLDVLALGPNTPLSVLYNDGAGGLRAPVSYPAPQGGDIEVTDMTNDGLDDVVSLVSGGNVAVTPQLALGGFGAATVYPGATNPWGFFGIGVGDVNGDGRTDVFSTYGGNKPNSFVALLVQNASGGLAAPVSYPSYDIPEPIDGADFDLDGLADVGVAHSWWNAFGVYLGRGDGTLAPEALYTLPFGNDYRQQGIDVGDINGDGAPDVVLANDSSGLVVLRNRTQVQRPAATPTFKGAVGGIGSVALTWKASPVASGYRIYRGTSSGSEQLLATVASATSFVDATAPIGVTEYYEVSAFNRVGESARSNELSAKAVAPSTAPGVPTLDTATAGNATVTLGWTAPSADGGAPITAYRIYRGTASNGETFFTQVGPVSSYTDTTAANGTTYYYRVAAVNSVGEGAQSNERSATPAVPDGSAPTKPSSLKLAVAGTTQLALDWAPSTDAVGVTGYEVLRNGVVVATTTRTQLLDANLPAGTSFTYAVRARDAAGNRSASSSSVNAKTVQVSNSASGTLAGAVYDTTGAALANVVVKLTLPNGTSKSGKTNSDGVWKFSNLAPAQYALTFTLAGHPAQTLNASPVAGRTVLAATLLA
jgi:fibronectin type 3 domain-containing protein